MLYVEMCMCSVLSYDYNFCATVLSKYAKPFPDDPTLPIGCGSFKNRL